MRKLIVICIALYSASAHAASVCREFNGSFLGQPICSSATQDGTRDTATVYDSYHSRYTWACASYTKLGQDYMGRELYLGCQFMTFSCKKDEYDAGYGCEKCPEGMAASWSDGHNQGSCNYCVSAEYYFDSSSGTCKKCPNDLLAHYAPEPHTDTTCIAGCAPTADGTYQRLTVSDGKATCVPLPHGCDNPYSSFYDQLQTHDFICAYGYRNVSDRVGYDLCLRQPGATSDNIPTGSISSNFAARTVYGTNTYSSTAIFEWHCPADTYLEISGAKGHEVGKCLPCPGNGWRRPRNPFKDELKDCAVFSGSDDTGTFEFSVSRPTDDPSTYHGGKEYTYYCLYKESQWTCSYLYCHDTAFDNYGDWTGLYDEDNPNACYVK